MDIRLTPEDQALKERARAFTDGVLLPLELECEERDGLSPARLAAAKREVIDFIEAGGVDDTFGAGALADILLYHVTNGRRISKSVVAAPGYWMLNGDRLSRSHLVAAGLGELNISASNGVIHIINSVLLP